MENKIYKILLQHIGKQGLIESLQSKFADKNAQIFEIVGGSGSGKTFIAKKLCEQLQAAEIDYEVYIPTIFSFNQFEKVFRLLSGIGNKEISKLLTEASELTTHSRYDFFYYLTEQLKKRTDIPHKVFIFENCDVLDRYTLDFIEFFVENRKETPTKIVALTKKKLFSFSEAFELPFLSQAEITDILSKVFPQNKTDLKTQSEILSSLSGGDIYILEHIINDISARKAELNMTTYVENKVNLSTVCLEKVNSLNDSQKYLIYLILLFAGNASIPLLESYFSKGKQGITKNGLKSVLASLKGKGLIEELTGHYYIKKKQCICEYFLSLPEEERKKMYRDAVPFMEKKVIEKGFFISEELPIISYNLNLYLFDKAFGTPSDEAFESAENYLLLIRDYDNLLSVLNNKLTLLQKDFTSSTPKRSEELKPSKTKSKKEFTYSKDKVTAQSKLTEAEKNSVEKLVLCHSMLGKIYKKINRYEEATNHKREALRIAVQFNLPLNETVYELADNLHKLNSLGFASEVIKKYSSSVTDPYWNCKLRLLQAEIQLNMNNDGDARRFIDEVNDMYVRIDDDESRQQILAESKKLLGKVFYYTNQWDKAEASFLDAGKIFSQLSNLEGQAAIYNNLGVLKMYRGEWEETEALYTKSLEIEKQLYSLDGISICYNNLGGLWADRSDYKKSLEFLNEALAIQILLNDRYNICNIYNNIGVTYMDNAEFDKAEDSFLRTMEVAKNFNLIKNLIAALNNLGALYFKSGNWSKAVECYKDAIDKSEKSKFIDGLCKSYNNLGELHEKRGDYELAYNLYFKAENIIHQLNDEFQKAEIWGNMGSVLTNLHKFSEAYGYLVESLDFFKTLSAQDKVIEGCHKMAAYFIATRNYESGKYYLEQALARSEEINNSYEIGKTMYLKGLLEKNDAGTAREYFEKAIKIFVETKYYYELALANYELAYILYEQNEWQQALEILNNNKNALKDFGALVHLEKNDILLQKIEKEFEKELKETKDQEYLLTKFYETTQNLKTISSFDTLLEYTLDSFVDLAEADGGIICLYNSRSNPDSWEYKLFNGITQDDKNYDTMMNIIQRTFQEGEFCNFKQPEFASQYNNIASFPLTFHNQNLGVILLFSKYGSHFISDKVCNLLNALCNQAVVIVENFRHNILTRSHAIIREELNAPQLFTNIIGKSEKMQKIFNIIDKVKDTPTTVLLEGQSGTGKELIARAIHYSSVRRNKKFIAQYCGSLPETLLESELFGHVKGSFTGATYDKKGLFEVADGGSFFLDEIADISLSTQAKLLRFLQEGEVKRVGSTKTQTVDVRVICATNVPLKEKIEKGEFRLDLFYRLNVIRIDVPRLCERKSDIPLLAVHFLDKYNKKMNKSVKGITDETMKCFENYEWPGNIRQLENEIERAVTLVDNNDYIKPSDLSEEIYRYTAIPKEYSFTEDVTLKEAVQILERNMIAASLKKTDWNQSQTAIELGLSRQGLIKKMKRYSLDK